MKLKNYITFLAVILFMAYFNSISANAECFSEDWQYNANATSIVNKKGFNVISSMNDDYLFGNTYELEEIYNDIKDHFLDSNDTFVYSALANGSNNDSIEIGGKFSIDENYNLYKIEYLYNNEVFFSCNVIDECNVTINTCKEIDLTKEYGDEYFTFDKIIGGEGINGGHPEFSDGIEDKNLFHFVMGLRIKPNEEFLGKDLYYITKNDNPLSLDEIIDSLNVIDYTDGVLDKNYLEVRSTDYNVNSDDSYVKPDTYKIDLIAFDKSRNIINQKIFVYVKDVIPPVISVSDIELESNNILSEDDIKKKFSATDESGDVTISIIEDDYFDNPTSSGNHYVKACATDEGGNKSYATMNINVSDKTKPTIKFTNKDNALYVTTASPVTLDQVKQMCTVTDNVDIISSDKIELEKTSYFGSEKIIGQKDIQLMVSDNSGNVGRLFITVYVVDDDYPKITGNDYMISVDKGVILTKEEIIDILVKTGQISSADVLNITSSYFATNNPEGTYILSIDLANGSQLYKTIKVIDTEDEKYNYDVPTKKSNNNTIMIVSISASILLIIIFSLGIVIYKKRH